MHKHGTTGAWAHRETRRAPAKVVTRPWRLLDVSLSKVAVRNGEGVHKPWGVPSLEVLRVMLSTVAFVAQAGSYSLVRLPIEIGWVASLEGILDLICPTIAWEMHSDDSRSLEEVLEGTMLGKGAQGCTTLGWGTLILAVSRMGTTSSLPVRDEHGRKDGEVWDLLAIFLHRFVEPDGLLKLTTYRCVLLVDGLERSCDFEGSPIVVLVSST